MESPEELADISHFVVKGRVDYAKREEEYFISISIFSLSFSHKTQKGFRVMNFKQVILPFMFYTKAKRLGV